MQRQYSAGRLGVVLALCCTVAACGQFSGLQAKKYFKDANALYQQQDYKRAAVAYEEALKADPDLSVAYFYLGNSYDQLYKPSRAGEQSIENPALPGGFPGRWVAWTDPRSTTWAGSPESDNAAKPALFSGWLGRAVNLPNKRSFPKYPGRSSVPQHRVQRRYLRRVIRHKARHAPEG